MNVVIFDYFGTLASSGAAAAWWERLPARVEEAGGRVTDEAWSSFTDLPDEHAGHSIDEASYEAWSEGRLDALLSTTGLDVTMQRRIKAEVIAERRRRRFVLYEDVAETLDRLDRMGIRVGVCSNWDWDLDGELRALGIAELVEFTVCSARVGYRKPHPAIFARVVEAARKDPGDILFVGDDWRADILGARGVGMRVLHVARQLPCPVEDHESVACSNDLSGVLHQLR